MPERKGQPAPIVEQVSDETSLRFGWWSATCPICGKVEYELRDKLPAYKRIDGHIIGSHLRWPYQRREAASEQE